MVAGFNFLASVGGGLRRTLTEEAVSNQSLLAGRRSYHALLRAYYENTVFEDARLWQQYKATHRLPRSARSVFNPTRRAVDFYPGKLYGGAWTEDGKPLPDGTPHALGIPSDVAEENPALVIAALQVLNWGQWREKRLVYVREGAMLGTAFVEIVDDLERGDVHPVVVPLERLVDITLDDMGNVKGYVLDYRAHDKKTDKYFDYKKLVTTDEIMVSIDRVVVQHDENPYGFVPAVWTKHRATLGTYGAPVIAGIIPKIDELNALASNVHGYIAKVNAQPVIFWSNQQPAPITAGAATDADTINGVSQEIRWMWGDDPDGKVQNMMQAVPIDGAGERIDKLLEEIEADLPEITMDDVIRDLPNASGPIIDRMLPGVRARYDEAQSNYDAGTIKIMQMGVAIAGWRLSTGAWGPRSGLDREQLKFDGFDLDSFRKGLLDLSLHPRPLVPQTEMERLQALRERKEVAGLSDGEVRRALGYSTEEIATLDRELAAQVERDSYAVI